LITLAKLSAGQTEELSVSLKKGPQPLANLPVKEALYPAIA